MTGKDLDSMNQPHASLPSGAPLHGEVTFKILVSLCMLNPSLKRNFDIKKKVLNTGVLSCPERTNYSVAYLSILGSGRLGGGQIT